MLKLAYMQAQQAEELPLLLVIYDDITLSVVVINKETFDGPCLDHTIFVDRRLVSQKEQKVHVTSFSRP